MKEIALMLNISVKTVETHRANLMQRLDLYNVPPVGSLRDQVRTDQLGRLAAYPCRGSRESLIIAKDALFSHSGSDKHRPSDIKKRLTSLVF